MQLRRLVTEDVEHLERPLWWIYRLTLFALLAL
jgi:hypothetical protein